MFCHELGSAGQSCMNDPAVFLQLADNFVGGWFFKAVQKKVRIWKTSVVAVNDRVCVSLQCLGNGPGKHSGFCLFEQASVGTLDQLHNQPDMIAEAQPPHNFTALFRETGR